MNVSKSNSESITIKSITKMVLIIKYRLASLLIVLFSLWLIDIFMTANLAVGVNKN